MDLYDYLALQSKIAQTHPHFPIRQYFMPARKKVTKDFLKLVFAGKKDLIPLAQVRPINVPRYDELSVSGLILEVMGQMDLAKFFPEQRTKADLPDREYVFSVINNIEPGYLSALVKHAQTQRNAPVIPQDNQNVIEVTEYWQKELQASPYFSRKLQSDRHSRLSRQDPDAAQEEIEGGKVRL